MKKKLLLSVLAAGLVLPSAAALAKEEFKPTGNDLVDFLTDPKGLDVFGNDKPLTEIFGEKTNTPVKPSPTEGKVEDPVTGKVVDVSPEALDEKLKEVEKEVSTVPTYVDKDGNVLNPETAGKLSGEVAGEESKKEEGKKDEATKPAAKTTNKAANKAGMKKLPKTSAVK